MQLKQEKNKYNAMQWKQEKKTSTTLCNISKKKNKDDMTR